MGIASVEKWPLLPRNLHKTTIVKEGNKNAATPGGKKVEKMVESEDFFPFFTARQRAFDVTAL